MYAARSWMAVVRRLKISLTVRLPWILIRFQICIVSLPVWKVCIARGRNPPRTFDAFYIFTIKFSKSPPRTLQTFQSGLSLAMANLMTILSKMTIDVFYHT
jgi:hypothetical protein